MKSHLVSAVPFVALVSLIGCAGQADSDVTTTAAVSGDAVTTTTIPTTRIAVTVGTDSDSQRVEKVALGAAVEITLTNPGVADNFHLHGYDVETGEVNAGTPATISFTADKIGDFEIESHVTEDVLVVIRVG